MGRELQVNAGATLDYESATSHDITIRVTDSGGLAYEEDVTINITDVNDAPTISNGDNINYNEGSGAAPFTTSTLTDNDSTDFDGGVLTFSIALGAEGGETLKLANIGGVTTTGGDVYVDGVLVGAQSGGNLATDFTVTFNADATVSRVELVYQALAIFEFSDNPTQGGRDLEVTITDGDGGTSNTATAIATLSVIYNDDPFNNGTLPTDISVTEDVSSDVDISSIDITDPDDNGGEISVSLSTSTGGNLTASASADITIESNGTDAITIQGTITDLNAYLNVASNIQYLHSNGKYEW